MKKLLAVLLLATACASVQKTEFKTASAAVAGVEAARSAYQDLDLKCTANPTYSALCPKVVGAHDALKVIYVKYQTAIKTLADANIAAINASNSASTVAAATAAGAGVIAVATDFVTMVNGTIGGK